MSAKKIKIVCFGGGTGLAGLLDGLKHNPRLEISAVVTMFDSGGSSGQLRDTFGVLPPGDIFRCILALAPEEDQATIRRIFNRRLAQGHSPGNLFMFGAERAYNSYQQAVDELCQTFSAAGRVYPVATQPSDLCAMLTDGSTARKETEVDLAIGEGKFIQELFLDPPVACNPAVLEVIRTAGVFCVGPGSFYTSVLPNFLPSGIREALRASTAPVIFVPNLMTEGLGMKHMVAADLVKTFETISGRQANSVIVNDCVPADLPEKYALQENKFPITRIFNTPGNDCRYFRAPLWTDGTLARHDSTVLSSVVWQVAYSLLKP